MSMAIHGLYGVLNLLTVLDYNLDLLSNYDSKLIS